MNRESTWRDRMLADIVAAAGSVDIVLGGIDR
jgi:NADH:ubiquinone oxidoreductase subunit D